MLTLNPNSSCKLSYANPNPGLGLGFGRGLRMEIITPVKMMQLVKMVQPANINPRQPLP